MLHKMEILHVVLRSGNDNVHRFFTGTRDECMAKMLELEKAGWPLDGGAEETLDLQYADSGRMATWVLYR